MRKVNVVFLGECIIIVALLLLIGNLLRTEENYVWGKEAAENAEQAADMVLWLHTHPTEAMDMRQKALQRKSHRREKKAESSNMPGTC